jgi:hypothetical protein
VPQSFQVDAQHLVTPVDDSDVCVAYDASWFGHDGRPPAPSTHDDLTDPRYKDLTVVENASTSSPGLAFLLATIATKGEDGWRAYWTALRKNGVRVDDDWTAAYETDFTAGGGSGSYTTKGGSTIDYAGAGRGGTTAGGVDYGRGVGGVQVTTPGGREVNKVGTAGGAVGPGGNAVGSRTGVTTGSGPGGSFGSAYHGGVAVGPQGGVATGGRASTITGAGGTVSGAARAGVAAGPYGAAAAGGAVARGAGGTYYRSAAAVSGQATTVRQNFRNFAQENPLLTARWVGPTWRPVKGFTM